MARTDPRLACANERQRFWWAVLHDALAHPLMALTGWSKWALRFHDWTSHKAWPRAEEPERRVILRTGSFVEVTKIEARLRFQGKAICTKATPHYIRGEWLYTYEVELLG